MTELEISEAYKKRFTTVEEVTNYINDLTEFDDTTPVILGNIIIIPSILDRMLIDTSSSRDFTWLDSNLINPQPAGWIWAPKNGYIPGRPEPSAHGISCNDVRPGGFGKFLHIHRNGCVQYLTDFGTRTTGHNGKVIYLMYPVLAVRLMHTFQFAYDILTRYNYFGDVRIRIVLKRTKDTVVPIPYTFIELPLCSSDNICVDREIPLASLESSFSQLVSNIMNEIFNHYKSRARCTKDMM